MFIFKIVLIFSNLTYITLITSYILGFIKLKNFNIIEHIKPTKNTTLSVIIPFKNEAEKLKNLIKNLNNQSLKKSKFEVIFVNDNSSDNSEHILAELIKNIYNFKIISSKKQGKKEAIKEGINNSQTNLIITTDADCIHQKHWLKTILNYYTQHKPKMIIAPVLMEGKSFFQKLQAIDFLSLTASTAGATGIKHPTMCNGANLIYEKSVFYEFNDALNNNEISGDDIFLLHNIKKKYKKNIHYLKSKEAIVYTEAEKSLKSFFKQRIRWASKSKSYNDFDTILSSLIVLTTNFLIVLLFFASIFSSKFLNPLIITWSLKFLIDFTFLFISGKYFTQNKNIYIIPLLSIIYPFYISYIAFISFFKKNLKWK